jgi:hypothetical protein
MIAYDIRASRHDTSDHLMDESRSAGVETRGRTVVKSRFRSSPTRIGESRDAIVAGEKSRQFHTQNGGKRRERCREAGGRGEAVPQSGGWGEEPRAGESEKRVEGEREREGKRRQRSDVQSTKYPVPQK